MHGNIPDAVDHALRSPRSLAPLVLTMGFLGGFSTLSTMNCEAVDMAAEGHRGEAAAYLVVTYGSTLGAAALSFALAHTILGG